MSHSVAGAYPVSGSSGWAIGAYAFSEDFLGGDYLRRRREYHIRRQAAKRIGARELWWGQRRTRRMY